MSTLNIALTALNTFQRGMDVTAHNIANVNTEGYKRQEMSLSAIEPLSPLQAGRGVKIVAITNGGNQFLDTFLNNALSNKSASDIRSSSLNNLEQQLTNPDFGLSTTLNNLISSFSDVSNDPTNIPARNVLLENINNFSNKMNSASNLLVQAEQLSSQQITSNLQEANSVIKNISALNGSLLATPNSATLTSNIEGEIANLAKFTDVFVSKNSDGTFNVISGGKSVVSGGSQPNFLTSSDVPNITGGVIGGLNQFVSKDIVNAKTGLNVLVNNIANFLNDKNSQGKTLVVDSFGNMQSGQDLFIVSDSSNAAGSIKSNISDPRAIASGFNFMSADGQFNTGTAHASAGEVIDKSLIPTSGFNVEFLTNSDYQIVDSFGSVVGSGVLTPGTSISALGFKFDLTGVPAAGDKFNISFNNSPNDNRNSMVISAGLSPYNMEIQNFISNIGASTREVNNLSNLNSSLYDSAKNNYQEVNDVNLDQEAVNMMKYSQYYQAAAKLIEADKNMWNTLLAIV